MSFNAKIGLMQYLLDAFAQHLSTTDPAPENNLSNFIAFADEYLATFTPLRLQYLDRGIGLVMSNNVLVAFSSKHAEVPPMRDEAVRVIGGTPSPSSHRPINTPAIPL